MAASAVSGRFSNLREFSGGLATVFLGTAVVESDFSTCFSVDYLKLTKIASAGTLLSFVDCINLFRFVIRMLIRYIIERARWMFRKLVR